jgi:nicotinate-nucleotide adenylyltransferase
VRLGLFGGAFDPIHNAHLFVAESVRAARELDRVIFLPTGAGRHRPAPRASLDQRAAMIRLAIAANPAFALDLSDADADATGYTADLIPRMRARYPGDALFFIAGADSLVRSRWQRFDDVLANLDGFYVAPRDGIASPALDAALAGLDPALLARVDVVDVPELTESATVVRARTEAGRSVRYLVPEPVWRYLSEQALYA